MPVLGRADCELSDISLLRPRVRSSSMPPDPQEPRIATVFESANETEDATVTKAMTEPDRGAKTSDTETGGGGIIVSADVTQQDTIQLKR